MLAENPAVVIETMPGKRLFERFSSGIVLLALVLLLPSSSLSHRGHVAEKKAKEEKTQAPAEGGAPATSGLEGGAAPSISMPDTVVANAYCPVRPDEEIVPERFVDYKGKRIYFCCKKCRQKFLADPETYLDNLPQFGGSGETMIVLGNQPGSRTEGGKEEVGFIGYVGRFHPLVVHFPIALIIFAGLAELLFMASGKEYLSLCSRLMLNFSAGFAVFSVLLGFADATDVPIQANLRSTFEVHRFMGITTAVLALLAALLARRVANDGSVWLVRLYRLVLLLAMLSVGVTGHFGGTLVFGPGYLSFPW